MTDYKEVETAIENGSHARRPAWPICKIIRGWRDYDADYFMAPIHDTKGIIMQICNNPCDCNIGIWIKNEEDVKATDWVITPAGAN